SASSTLSSTQAMTKTSLPGLVCKCAAECGDGILVNGEQCDDGNLLNGGISNINTFFFLMSTDGCSSKCTFETDVTAFGTWQCRSDSSPTRCMRCGDGKVQWTESCDDGNTNNND